jgi:hypothetical protein
LGNHEKFAAYVGIVEPEKAVKLKNTATPTLTEADLTSTVNHLYSLLEQNPELFPELFGLMLHSPNSRIRLRAGNAVEKAARENQELLIPFKGEILAVLPASQYPDIIWHVVLLLGYIDLEDDEQALAVNTIYQWLDTIQHKFIKINCLQTLAVLAKKHEWLRGEVTETLQAALEHESPSIRARARILLKQLSATKR